MKILLLTHRVPYPPDRGDRIRSLHVLKFLAERSDVSLACTTEEPVDVAVRRYLASLCQQVAICLTTRLGRATRAGLSLAGGRTATEGHFWHPQLAATLRQWSHRDKFDAVVCYCSSMYRYTRAEEFANTPVVVDLVDVDSQKWLDYADSARGPVRWLYGLEGLRVRRLEQELANRSQAITVVSQAEADLLRGFCPRAKVQSVPNGVDLDHFQSDCDDVDAGRSDCVFVGALDYRPNVDGVSWLCREVWPAVHARFPQATFVLVGRRPVAQIRRLAAQPGVELVGEVPDVRPYLQRARVAVVPLRIARGIQNKVLEALAAGKPVIASPQALEGLDVVPGEHVYQAETPGEWVAGISHLLSDEVECRRLSAAGREFVCRYHRWDNCLQPLERLLGLAKIAASTSSVPVVG